MSTTLALTEELWRELADTLDERRETAGFILAGSAADLGEVTLFARSVYWISDDDYLVREPDRLTIGSEAIVAALKAAAQDGSVAIFFHSHPGSDPSPSRHDDKVDEQLREPAQIRTAQEIYASLILGGCTGAESFSGRVFSGEQSSSLIASASSAPTSGSSRPSGGREISAASIVRSAPSGSQGSRCSPRCTLASLAPAGPDRRSSTSWRVSGSAVSR